MKEIRAKIISGIKYNPLMCSQLEIFDDLAVAMDKRGSFILKFERGLELAISWWVSPKRTRSYPYSRVYDTLGSQLKKVTIIPVLKDEGQDGDRDFIQWDTISLMSLLNIYVVLAYYSVARKNPNYCNKITDQKFDFQYINRELLELLNYKSDALHWNLKQIEKIEYLTKKAVEFYKEISKKTGVRMHPFENIKSRIASILKYRDAFMEDSRRKARQAQRREVGTKQPKEETLGEKGILTIKNYLGGIYYFTCDEVEESKDKLYLIEAKHTKYDLVPSISDIKDGLLKMVLYVNLEEVELDGNQYKIEPILKLTSNNKSKIKELGEREKSILENVRNEASINGFKLIYNNEVLI